jgi:hypothetical protein
MFAAVTRLTDSTSAVAKWASGSGQEQHNCAHLKSKSPDRCLTRTANTGYVGQAFPLKHPRLKSGDKEQVLSLWTRAVSLQSPNPEAPSTLPHPPPSPVGFPYINYFFSEPKTLSLCCKREIITGINIATFPVSMNCQKQMCLINRRHQTPAPTSFHPPLWAYAR